MEYSIKNQSHCCRYFNKYSILKVAVIVFSTLFLSVLFVNDSSAGSKGGGKKFRAKKMKALKQKPNQSKKNKQGKKVRVKRIKKAMGKVTRKAKRGIHSVRAHARYQYRKTSQAVHQFFNPVVVKPRKPVSLEKRQKIPSGSKSTDRHKPSHDVVAKRNLHGRKSGDLKKAFKKASKRVNGGKVHSDHPKRNHDLPGGPGSSSGPMR